MLKSVVRGWLLFVASLRALSVGLAYLKPDTLQEQVFAIAKDQSSALALRAFGIWTLLSGTVTVLCALNIESGPLYRATVASFAIALFYFALEVGVYKTVEPRSAISPGVIATLSLVLMTAGYSSIVSDAAGAGKKKK